MVESRGFMIHFHRRRIHKHKKGTRAKTMLNNSNSGDSECQDWLSVIVQFKINGAFKTQLDIAENLTGFFDLELVV